MQRILLVEDNEMNRDLIARKLQRRGYEVTVATDGAMGVEKTKTEKPDLVLMDIGLPVLDGYEATRLIKADEATRRIPVIGLSAHAMSGDSDKAMQAGVDDYDTKPIEWPRLLGKIQKLLDRAAERLASGEAKAADVAAAVDSASGKRVLLIHDSPLHREMLAGRMVGRGYDLVVASSTVEAVGLLEGDGDAFAAVLLDTGLAPVDGRSPLDLLRGHSQASALPIILLSPVDGAQDAVARLGNGADEVVLQPFRPEELVHRLDRCIAHASGGASTNASAEASVDAGLERQRSRHLARAILPEAWIETLERERRLPPKALESVAVLSLELPGLHALAEARNESALNKIQQLLIAIEGIADDQGLFASGLQGSRLMLFGGPFSGNAKPASACVQAGLRLLAAIRRTGTGNQPRLGVHAGPATAAVLGRRALRFGLWGEAPRVAGELRNAGHSAVFVSDPVWRALGDRSQGERVGQLGGEGGQDVWRVDGMVE